MGTVGSEKHVKSWPFNRCIQGRSQSLYHVEAIANNKGADQTARMRRLVCAFVIRK